MPEEKKLIRPIISLIEEQEKQKPLIHPIQHIEKEEAPKKDPELREYLVLLTYESQSSGVYDYTSFEFKIGRSSVYDFIKAELLDGDCRLSESEDAEIVSIHKSWVLVEGSDITCKMSVYQFMRRMRDKNFFPGDPFDIEDYNDIEEDDESSSQEERSKPTLNQTPIEKFDPLARFESSEDI